MTFEYDALGRVTKETNADSTYRQRTYGLDSITVRDDNGHETVYTRSAFGHPDDARLTGVLDAASQQWTYTYSVAGALATVEGPGSVERTWTYNAQQLLASETHPESGTVTYQVYDAAGVLKQKLDAKGTTFKYTHDGNDRVRTITAGSRVTTITYEPGSDNRAAASVSGGVSSSFGYDAAGRLTSRVDVLDGRTMPTRFVYDANDNLQDVTYPSGRTVHYAYDDANRITGISRPSSSQSYATSFTYHASGALTGYTGGNSVVTTLAYDANRQWLTSLQSGALSLTYQYDDAGNVEGITDTRPGMSQLFEYDALDRLVTASGPYTALSYAYDAHGNRTGSDYTYDSGNPFRLVSFAGTAIEHDSSGNLTRVGPAGSPLAAYSFNPNNQIDVSTAGGVVTRFTYDADDWRVKKSVDGGAASYYVRGPNGQLLTEIVVDGATTTLRDHIYAGSRLITVASSMAP